MDISLYQAAAGMNAGSRWQEIIADNLSASQVPAYKKQELTISGVPSGFMMDLVKAGMNSKRFQMPLAATSTDFKSGELRPTGGNADFAVDGPGFFAVQLPDGSRGYTRTGNFHISPQGQLVTQEGMSVLGDNGPLQLDPSQPMNLSVAATGELSQNGVVRGRFELAEFNDPSALSATGTGVYFPENAAVQPQPATSSSVQQGYLEAANTSPLMEMGNLITALRFYEANQKVIQTEDTRLGELISQVANPS